MRRPQRRDASTLSKAEIEANVALYLPALDHITYHENDPNLDTIIVKLPKAPDDPTKIDGYGLHPRDQFWEAPKQPPRLKQLAHKFGTIDKIRSYLEQHQMDYADEIAFINREWERRQNGYWLYILGRPFFMVGWHYFYCGYYQLDIGLPRWYERDWMWFHFVWFAYNDTTLPDGTDMGVRICFGVNYPKMRREGASYRAECINFCITTSFFKAFGGIQSMTGKSARKIYRINLVGPFKKLPFFFKPQYDGTTNPQTELKFDIPARKLGAMAYVESGLEGGIDFADTAGEGSYDGVKLLFWHEDEFGKTVEADVNSRWRVVKQSLGTGAGRKIVGFTIATSTVGEMTDKGGAMALEVCKKSHWGHRLANGQTQSGKYNLFLDSVICLDGYIDFYGFSIIEDPKESDLWRIPSPSRDTEGKLMGAARYLDSHLEDLIMQDSEDAQEDYQEQKRLYPREFADCFTTKGAGSGLPLKIIIARIKELQFMNEATKGVNYEWDRDPLTGREIFGTRVHQIANEKDGRFRISLDLPEQFTNQRFKQTIWDGAKYKEVWAPKGRNPQIFTVCGDPFKFAKTKGKRRSFGAMTIFWDFDDQVDSIDKPIDQWESFRTVLTYIYRAETPEEMVEDCLKACIYWGCKMFPEIDIPIIWNMFVLWEFDGYLKYATSTAGVKKNTPGFNSRGSQQTLLNKVASHLTLHGMRERHIDYLRQCKNLKGIEDLTNNDLVVTGGGSMMGNDYKDLIQFTEAKRADISTIFPTRRK